MMGMIEIEMQEIENIQKELNGGAISLDDIENRWGQWAVPVFLPVLNFVLYLDCRRRMTKYPSSPLSNYKPLQSPPIQAICPC